VSVEYGNRLLFVLVSLEFFYETGQGVIKDVEDIKEALFNILDKNSDSSMQKLVDMLQRFDSLGNTIQQISQLKSTLNHFISSYQKLLREIVKTEKETVKAIDELEENHNEGKISDVNYVHRKRVLDEKKDHSVRLKQQILKNMTSAVNKCDNIYLKSDKCDFENTILVDAVIKNIKENEKEIQKNSA
jgi:mevalonate kinase